MPGSWYKCHSSDGVYAPRTLAKSWNVTGRPDLERWGWRISLSWAIKGPLMSQGHSSLVENLSSFKTSPRGLLRPISTG